MVVDHQGVAVPRGAVPVRVDVRLRPLPALVVVRVVLVVDVRVLMDVGGCRCSTSTGSPDGQR